MAKPRTTLPSEPDANRRASSAVKFASSSTTGEPVKSGSVVPSITTVSVIAGKNDASVIVCGPKPVMLNWISSGPPLLAVLLVARIASRNEIDPSAPGELIRAATELTSPSLTSAVVLTVTVARIPDQAATPSAVRTPDASTLPTWYSSDQSPVHFAWPVMSVLAATSMCVKSAKLSSSDCPADDAARLQP